MDSNKMKEGVSVKEIENFVKKHRFEVFFGVAFVLGCFFSFVFFTKTTLFFAAVGAVLGVLLTGQIDSMLKQMFRFVAKQEQTTQFILAIVGWILCIFLPPLIFLLMGLSGGKALAKMTKETSA